MAAKAELKGKVSLNPRDWRRGLRVSMRSLKQFGAGALRVGKAVGLGFVAAFGAATAAVAAAAKMTANYGDQLAKTAKRTGLTVQALAELQHAAKLSDSSLAGLDKGIGRMQRVIFEATQGLTTYVRVFDELGLSLDKVAKATPEEQFRIMTEALAGVEDKTKRAALAQQIFGRAGRQLLPMLSGGIKELKNMRQEAHRLGLVITPEQAKSAENFNDALTRVSGAVKGLIIQSMGLDKMTGLLEKAVDWLVELRETGAFKRLSTEVVNAVTQLLGFEGGAGNVGAAIDKITAGLKQMNQQQKFKNFANDIRSVVKLVGTLARALWKIHEVLDITSDIILGRGAFAGARAQEARGRAVQAPVARFAAKGARQLAIATTGRDPVAAEREQRQREIARNTKISADYAKRMLKEFEKVSKPRAQPQAFIW